MPDQLYWPVQGDSKITNPYGAAQYRNPDFKGSLPPNNVGLDIGAAERDAIERLRVFVRGRQRVESDTGGPAGDMLFKDTAIRVRLVGALLARGAEPKKMLTAFPALEADDIAFAGMFARLNKGPGSASTGRARAARRPG